MSIDHHKPNTPKQADRFNNKTAMTKMSRAWEALRDAVVLIDSDDTLTWWNLAAAQLLSLQESDKGKSIFDCIQAPEFQQYYQEVIAANDVHHDIHHDGVQMPSWRDPKRYLKCEITAFDEDKLLMIYDVTRLQHLEEMRRDFVANVSHELRTPLTVLMGYLENFSDQADIPPKWQRGLELMTQQTARMNRIVNDLLLLSKIEIEEHYELARIDMTKLLTHVYDDAQAYNQEYGHTIHLQIDTYEGLYGSEMYLNSALSNLVINAIKYTPKGGNIEISWIKTAQGCQFSVTDNGIGIAPAHITRLTERFYRVDSGRSRATGGTGLGLAIVKHVLHQYNTSLQIESTVDIGSTFSATFNETFNI